MPIPSNLTALTAIDMGTLPYSVTQVVDFAGTSYDVWYSYTPPIGVYEIGVWGFGDLVIYTPTLLVFTGPASAPVPVFPGISAVNVPIQIPVTPGTLYLFQFLTNSAGATPCNLAISSVLGPTESIPAGSFVIMDDVADFPTAFIDPTTNNNVLNYNPVVLAGEWGDVLSDGTFLTDDISTADLNFYDASLNRTAIAFPTASNGTNNIRTCRGAQKIYFSDPGDSGAAIHAGIYKVDGDGVLSTVAASLGVFGCDKLAATNDETLVYVTGAGVSTTGSPVFTWNVGTAAFVTDFVAGLANYAVFDILILSDDTVVIGYFKSSITRDILVKIFDSAGALLHTISYGSNTRSLNPHLAYALDDPTSFWLWVHPSTPDGESDFINYAADGTTIATRTYVEYENGTYSEAVTATPTARFGISNSCPFWIATVTVPPIVPPVPSEDHSGIYHIDPGKTFDEIYNGATTDPTLEVKIPDPTVRLFPLGE